MTSNLMKRILPIIFALNIDVVESQQFWHLTYEFHGGAKTGITTIGDTCLFVSVRDGVMKSNDWGNSFHRVLTAQATHTIMADKSGYLYAGGTGYIYISDDIGLTWDSVKIETEVPVLQMIEDKDGDIFAITSDLYESNIYAGDGVFYSGNKGKNWESRNNGLNHFLVCDRMATDQYGRLYLAVADETITGNGGLFISENKGVLWKHIPVLIDGKGTVQNKPKIQYTHGLTVTNNDTIYLSFEGSAGGFVSFNLKISIDSLLLNKNWELEHINIINTWYMDTPLQNRFFSSDGSVFSSTTGTIGVGKTYVNLGWEGFWRKVDYGLGVGKTGREAQFFVESPDEKIYMVQRNDERVYWTHRNNMVLPVPENKYDLGFRLKSNVITAGGSLQTVGGDIRESYMVSVYSMPGRMVSGFKNYMIGEAIDAPSEKGLYFLVIRSSHQKQIIKFLVI